jgi:hypothetical protein
MTLLVRKMQSVVSVESVGQNQLTKPILAARESGRKHGHLHIVGPN